MTVCERCGVTLEPGDAVVFTPKVGESVSVCQSCSDAMKDKLLPKIGLLNILGALALGVVFAVPASALWYLICVYFDSISVIFAMGIGALVGLGVYLGSGMKKSYIQVLIGALLAGLAMGFGMFLVVRHAIITAKYLEHARMFVSPVVMLRLVLNLIRVEPMLACDWLIAVVIGGGVVFPRKYSVSSQRVNLFPESAVLAAAQSSAIKRESDSHSYVFSDLLAVLSLVLAVCGVFTLDNWGPLLVKLLNGLGLSGPLVFIAEAIIGLLFFEVVFKSMFLLFMPRDLSFSPVNAANLPALDQLSLGDYTAAIESLGFVQLGDYQAKGKMLIRAETSFQRVFFHPKHHCYAAITQSIMSGSRSSAAQCGMLSIFNDGWTFQSTPMPSQDLAMLRGVKSAWYCRQNASFEKILAEHLELTAQLSLRQGLQLKSDGSTDTYMQAVREMQRRKRVVTMKKSVLALFGRLICQGLKPRTAWLVDPSVLHTQSAAAVASPVVSAARTGRPGSGDFFYRTLGSVAKASSDMRRFSINGMPSNYLVVVLLAFIIFFSAQYFWEALRLPSSYPSYYLALIVPALLGAAILAIMVAVIVRKYVIFRPMPSSQTGAPLGSLSEEEEKQVDLRITGQLRLNPKMARRFLDVPAAVAKLDTGERVFLSRIDASSTMYGIKTNNLQGIWLMAIKPGTLKQDSEGFLYIGRETRPALQLSFTDLHSGKPSRAVLSFDSEGDRSIMQSILGLR